MTIQQISHQHQDVLAQLANAHLKAKEVEDERNRLDLVAAQVGADIAQLEQAVAVLRLTLQVLEEQPASAPEDEVTA